MKKQNLKLVRGDDVSFRFSIKDSTGQPLALKDLRFDLHLVSYQGEVLIALSTDDGSIETAEAGQMVLHFSHQQTARAEWTSANYDLQLTTAEGKRKTIMYGVVQLTHDYTRV
ncbi:hypothetical protein [Mannheimia haemolytica]|uniref:Uncharacterized protein n=2 Tax=Mannheimia haemolytica TaxID=75985 RepID=A0A378NFS5_MANHA|nr:hypothetical protein [Mannheimia haemolytica]MDW0545052.1 hypothetical protein [Mannheimia haemolytica]TCS87032.1 hypothetical protein EDC41_12161 [Mannheimia haemolytica]UQX63661.1 hypothetical protein M3709_04125 [Mannheimia haemolytica]UQX69363.1 hypothetical protein M3705_10290 [Mannheimia haemolytica]STY67274.1 Uncharacterised protein [Mannheimia haemolytica]